MEMISLDGENLTIEDVAAVASAEGIHVRIAAEAQEKIRRARRAVEEFVERGEIIYGVTTGFGAFKDRLISPEQTEELQHNMLKSHAVGVGEPLDEGTVRAAMLIRANTLAKGYSGIRLETLEALLALINHGVHPVIPAKGSLGASGDLAPLAHMALILIGEGEAFYRAKRMPGVQALHRAGLAPIQLGAKEGLALINGTAVMAAIGALTIWQAERLSRIADIAGARGVTVWLAAITGLLAEWWLEGLRLRWRRWALGLFALLMLPIGYSLIRWSTLETRPAARVLVVQPNIPEDLKLGREAALDSSRIALGELTNSALAAESDIDLIVWPETAQSYFY
jgi:histidine ammonia-lyase